MITLQDLQIYYNLEDTLAQQRSLIEERISEIYKGIYDKNTTYYYDISSFDISIEQQKVEVHCYCGDDDTFNFYISFEDLFNPDYVENYKKQKLIEQERLKNEKEKQKKAMKKYKESQEKKEYERLKKKFES